MNSMEFNRDIEPMKGGYRDNILAVCVEYAALQGNGAATRAIPTQSEPCSDL